MEICVRSGLSSFVLLVITLFIGCTWEKELKDSPWDTFLVWVCICGIVGCVVAVMGLIWTVQGG